MISTGQVPRGAPRRRGRLSLLAAAVAVVIGAALAAVAPSPASAATVDTSAWYVLVNRNSGKALDVYNLATNDGARITQWT
ncbi:RICIN domain-containing protein, partial [Micromonospora sp. NPDC003944]